MGISGLLPLLSEAQRKGHVKEFAGQTVGVDSYIWLYKGAFSCAVEVGLGQPTTKYVTSFMARARMLRHHGVEPLFVFDGGPLPSKRETELERQRQRGEKRQRAIELWAQGRRKPAFEMFQRCLEATPQMAKAVIEQLAQEGFRYLVAPYEADAQLAFLESQGVIAAAISEDSDLVAFGCGKVLFKMDQCGAGTVFDRARIHRAKAVDIRGWSDAQIRRMCILSGCDYAASAPGIGLKRAHRYAARATDVGMAVRLMRADGVPVPDGYEEAVVRAELTFQFQRVYDPRTRALAHVLPLPAGVRAEDMPFVGAALDPRVAQDIAVAAIDPFTLAPFERPDAAPAAPEPAAKTPPAKASKAKAPKAKATPAAVRGTLVGLWKKSAFATISAKPSPVVAVAVAVEAAAAAEPTTAPVAPLLAEQQLEEGDDDVRVKFRARDTRGELVATGQRSRSQCTTQAVDDPAPEPSLASIGALLSRFKHKASSASGPPAAISMPVCSRQASAGGRSLRFHSPGRGLLTLKQQASRRISAGAPQLPGDTTTTAARDCASPKRKDAGHHEEGLLDAARKHRCTALAHKLAAHDPHFVDDIVDSSDNDKENAVYV
ncbi:hypothetical protein H4R18_003664 [Coemansia javaensis]|uniref:Exonuclease 1 n=1 Tax=Coemansia javaensis TaxID=2761396 RepID=A0A9W8HEM1_9FUNG|nr:hypothetical protein H4R18_003664 [Coemansia javaensis]